MCTHALSNRVLVLLGGLLGLGGLFACGWCGSAAAQIDEALCVFGDRITVEGERTPYSIVQDGELLYAAMDGGELVIFDISDPHAVTRVGSTHTTPSPEGPVIPLAMALKDGHLFLSLYRVGLEVIDVSDPTAPKSLGVTSFDNPFTEHWSAAISGDTLYLGNYGELTAVDITNLAAPVIVSTLDLPFGVYLTNLEVVGDELYSADGDLSIFDISDRHSPSQVNRYTAPWVLNSCLAHANGLYVTSLTKGLLLYDLSDPVNPVLVNTLELPEGGVDIAAEGQTIVVSATAPMIHTIDVSDPYTPRVLRTTPTSGLTWQLGVKHGYAYVSEFFAGTGMVIYETLGERASLPVYSSLDAPGEVYDAAVRGDLLFRATENHGVQVFDVSDPEAIELLSVYGDTFDYLAVGAVGDLMITSERTYGLRVVDISDPANPVRLTELFGDRIEHIDVQPNGRVYVTFEGEGMYELDITDPTNPAVITNNSLRLQPALFVMQGTTAYILEDPDDSILEFFVVDLANPQDPTLLGTIELISSSSFQNEYVTDFAIHGDTGYLVDENAQLWLFDVSDLSLGVQIVRPIPIDEACRHITIRDDVMLLSGENMATRVYRLADDGTPIWLGILNESTNLLDAYTRDETILGVIDEGLSIIDLGDCAPVCPADTNHDGLLTPADFTSWINAFNTNAPECDQNFDSACTPTDFTAWIENFNRGC